MVISGIFFFNLKKNDDNTDSQTVPSTHDGWVGNRLSQRPAFPLHRAIDSLWKRCCVDSAGGEPNLWPSNRPIATQLKRNEK